MRSLTRRSVVAGGTAAAIALALQKIAIADAKAVYRDAIVIDGLGGLGNSSAPPGAPLTDAFVGDVRGSGITSVHMTILPVGSTPPDTAFTEAVLGIGKMENEIDRHPDVLSRVRKVADVAEAKKTGRTGFIYGFQDAVAFERISAGSTNSTGSGFASFSRPTTAGIYSETDASRPPTRASARLASKPWNG